MPDPVPRLRFAPSPNGELHLGHAYSALKTWQIADRLGGEVLLRIEDIDMGRTRQHYIDQIFEDLDWLGLSWPEPVRRQSEYFDDYRSAARKLSDLGLLYPCAATRKEIASAVADRPGWPTDPDGAPLYPGLWKIAGQGDPATKVSPGTPVAHRIDMDRALNRSGKLQFEVFDEDGTVETRTANPAEWGDAIIVRKDTPTSYHLSVVVDDALQGITHVTRGRDLEAATSLHVLLQKLLGLPSLRYHHHRLITDSAGRKLSKSLRDTSLRHLRDIGWTPADVYTAVGL
ncbi:MAG: tRNA glutamyl-Q(34) synthetase GluQRS [Hyphomicrobiaceae bacterium]